MVRLTSIFGSVSHIERFANTSGTIRGGSYQGTGSISGSIRTDERTLFRINNQPVSYPGTPSLSEGEEVTLILKGRKQASVAIQNHDTGTIYSIGLITTKDITKTFSITGLLVLFSLISGYGGLFLLSVLISFVVCGRAMMQKKYRQKIYQLGRGRTSASVDIFPLYGFLLL